MNKEIDINKIEKILVIRTDRIGDVVLSTPVLETLRTHFPFAKIAMMVSPQTRELVEGNPYLDEVIVYDKSGPEKPWAGTFKFALRLAKKKFDIAIILHPTNRAHWVAFLAGIPVRLGYRYKNYRLLTHTIPHMKPEGKKHESEYNFDLLKLIKIETPLEMNTYVPLNETSFHELNRKKQEANLNGSAYVVLSPGASCPSKMWAPSRFAEVSDRIQEKYGLPVVLIGGEKEKSLAERIKAWTKKEPVDLIGKLSLSQTAWLLKDAELLVSNDSGPVHIAVAVGTPVISIFGRKQPGLSPVRWKPLGSQSTVIHKDVGCEVCTAHLCDISFSCLDAISVEEVMQAVETYQACFSR